MLERGLLCSFSPQVLFSRLSLLHGLLSDNVMCVICGTPTFFSGDYRRLLRTPFQHFAKLDDAAQLPLDHGHVPVEKAPFEGAQNQAYPSVLSASYV